METDAERLPIRDPRTVPPPDFVESARPLAGGWNDICEALDDFSSICRAC